MSADTDKKTADKEYGFLKVIQKYSGLTVSSSHMEFMRSFVAKRQKELSLSEEEYCRRLEEDMLERTLVIDEAAINETYFFREESQFDFLRDVFFPAHRNAVIWSAACSTGEEAVSLYALARSCGVNAEVYASDIDEKALSQIQGRIYPPHSFRNEGSTYLKLLEPLGTYYPKSFTMSEETLSKLHVSRFNLVADTEFPMPERSVDLLFLRNVFIYFTSETRKAVLRKMADAMKDGALLFLSINEIASVECDADLPFIKECSGSVYYLKKVSPEEKQNVQEKKKERIPPGKKEAFTTGRTVPPVRKPIESVRGENPRPPISRLYGQIKEALEAGGTDEAEKLLSSYKFRPVEMEHELYMKGMIFEAEGRDSEALDCYLRASILNPKFWPASYSLGMLNRKAGNRKAMEKAFSSCSDALRTYIKNGEICYNDIVDSFSPDYFLELCESQLEGGR